MAFAFSAALAGLSGGLLAPLVGYVSPGSFTFTLSLLYFAMVVFGGLGSLSGALLGSLLVGYGFANLDVIVGLPAVGPVLHALSERYLSVAGLPYVGWVLLGAVILCATVVTSGGLAAIWRPARTSRD